MYVFEKEYEAPTETIRLMIKPNSIDYRELFTISYRNYKHAVGELAMKAFYHYEHVSPNNTNLLFVSTLAIANDWSCC